MTREAEAVARATCEVCGAHFSPPAYRVRRGHGKTCSRLCGNKKATQAFAQSRPKATPDEIVSFLWANVKTGEPSECWPWTRSANVKGRGVLSLKGFRCLAPRVAFFAAQGRWPATGMFVCHTCDNPSCCNPSHLWEGTPKDNAVDMARKGRVAGQNANRKFCIYGHEYTPENTYHDNRGRRSCKACKKVNTKRSYVRRRSQERQQ